MTLQPNSVETRGIASQVDLQRAPHPQPNLHSHVWVGRNDTDHTHTHTHTHTRARKFVASHLGNTSNIGTNTPQIVSSRWGWPPFDLLKRGCAHSVVGLEFAEFLHLPGVKFWMPEFLGWIFCCVLQPNRPPKKIWMRLLCLQLEASYLQWSFFTYSGQY